MLMPYKKVESKTELSKEEYVKYASKLRNLIKVMSEKIPIPPRFAQMVDWRKLQIDVMRELPKHKAEIKPTIEKCLAELQKPSRNSGISNLIGCVDAVGEMLKINKMQLGGMEGSLSVVLRSPDILPIIPQIIQTAVAELRE